MPLFCACSFVLASSRAWEGKREIELWKAKVRLDNNKNYVVSATQKEKGGGGGGNAV